MYDRVRYLYTHFGVNFQLKKKYFSKMINSYNNKKYTCQLNDSYYRI